MDKMIFLLGSLVYSLILKHIFVSFVTQVVVILSALSATGITSAAWGQAAVVTKYQSSVQYRVSSVQYRVQGVGAPLQWRWSPHLRGNILLAALGQVSPAASRWSALHLVTSPSQ